MKQIRVLLADSDESLLASYQEALLWDGFDVATVSNGLECLAALRRSAPDVLVVDLEMPWGQGDDVLAMMHEEPELPVVPVIALSMHRELGAPERPESVPINRRLLKPVEPRELAKAIRELVDRPRSELGR